MTGKDIYLRAIVSLGYKDNQTFKDKAVVVINQVYEELLNSFPGCERKTIASLNETVDLPDTVCSGAMVYGVAERLALGEGDGELQQYFAMRFDRAKARLNVVDRIQDVFPR